VIDIYGDMCDRQLFNFKSVIFYQASALGRLRKNKYKM